MNKAKGFTLIELLVVIAVLGILMAAILAGIDPLQQIKKGRDTATRNMMVEYNNALLRYNAIQGIFPWNQTATSGTLNDVAFGPYTSMLANAGELKTNFIAAAGTQNLAKIFINTAEKSAVICFNPESKAFQGDPQAQYTSTGAAGPAGCPSSLSLTCWICIRAE